jgi:rubrerythrin
MAQSALIEVLGAVAYGERKAYEQARARAEQEVDEEQRRTWRKVAAEELRHYKGFVRRLEALGADPDAAMRPYGRALDRYHASTAGSALQEAVFAYLGEGIADDLLGWLRTVADPETAAFVETVIADEEGHEARATAELRAMLDADPRRRLEAAGAALRMLGRMVASGQGSYAPFGAFLRLGWPHELLGRLAGGYLRRLRALRIDPLGLVTGLAA